jgi:4,5:9,10-diseco-3-hydroxy-5,9,17-trioxoandrosta-1(10),2-diene-4-oate hydrolase
MGEMCPDLQHHWIEVNGIATHYVTAGQGEPIVLLHGDGENLFDWTWTLPALARTYRVYALDFPGAGDSAKPPLPYSAAFLADFLHSFLDTLGITRTALLGNSGGGLVALCLALSRPERITALTLLDSAGLGATVNPGMIAATLPGAGEIGVAWSRTPLGAAQRARLRAALQFAHPLATPASWLAEQERLAQLPGFLEASLALLRSQLLPWGQRIVVLDQLYRLQLPVLVIWGTRDLVLPAYQARLAIDRLPHGTLALIGDCGHVPHVERPAETLRVLQPFLAEHVS